jgi:Sigma-70 region 2
MDERDWLAERFQAHRARLRAVAYRMLGSTSEADDAVQEAWIRLSRSNSGEIDNLEAWLVTAVGRVALNMLRARKTRGEEPLDAHLSDPIVDGADGIADGIDPEHEALLADSVGLALLVSGDQRADHAMELRASRGSGEPHQNDQAADVRPCQPAAAPQTGPAHRQQTMTTGHKTGRRRAFKAWPVGDGWPVWSAPEIADGVPDLAFDGAPLVGGVGPQPNHRQPKGGKRPLGQQPQRPVRHATAPRGSCARNTQTPPARDTRGGRSRDGQITHGGGRHG